MTNFAGTATGQTREEQVFILNQWVNYRTRGGPSTIDGFFSPTTKTPYTDEFQFQYEVDLGRTHERVGDVLQPSDPRHLRRLRSGALHRAVRLPGQHQRSEHALPRLGILWLDGGEPPGRELLPRHAAGQQAELQRPRAGRSGSDSRTAGNSLASNTYLDATGNAISDGNADFAGDVLWLDPRALNNQGTVAGTIHRLFKAGASYTTRFDLELGAAYRWNSGPVVNTTEFASNRRLPLQGAATFVEPGNDGPVDCRWRDWRGSEPVVGPARHLRIQYIRPIRPSDGGSLPGYLQRHEQPVAPSACRISLPAPARRSSSTNSCGSTAERVPRRADPFLSRFVRASRRKGEPRGSPFFLTR